MKRIFLWIKSLFRKKSKQDNLINVVPDTNTLKAEVVTEIELVATGYAPSPVYMTESMKKIK